MAKKSTNNTSSIKVSALEAAALALFPTPAPVAEVVETVETAPVAVEEVTESTAPVAEPTLAVEAKKEEKKMKAKKNTPTAESPIGAALVDAGIVTSAAAVEAEKAIEAENERFTSLVLEEAESLWMDADIVRAAARRIEVDAAIAAGKPIPAPKRFQHPFSGAVLAAAQARVKAAQAAALAPKPVKVAAPVVAPAAVVPAPVAAKPAPIAAPSRKGWVSSADVLAALDSIVAVKAAESTEAERLAAAQAEFEAEKDRLMTGREKFSELLAEKFAQAGYDLATDPVAQDIFNETLAMREGEDNSALNLVRGQVEARKAELARLEHEKNKAGAVLAVPLKRVEAKKAREEAAKKAAEMPAPVVEPVMAATPAAAVVAVQPLRRLTKAEQQAKAAKEAAEKVAAHKAALENAAKAREEAALAQAAAIAASLVKVEAEPLAEEAQAVEEQVSNVEPVVETASAIEDDGEEAGFQKLTRKGAKKAARNGEYNARRNNAARRAQKEVELQ